MPTIVIFATVLVGGAAKPDYGQAAKKLPSTGAFVLVSRTEASHGSSD